MLDVAADSGWLQTSLNIMHLVKMIIQGCWLKDDPLLQLPLIEPYQIQLFYQLRWVRFWQWVMAPAIFHSRN